MKKVCYISEISSTTKDWTAVVTVDGKGNPHTSPSGHVIQKLVLTDGKGDQVEGVIWNHNIEGLKHELELFKKYEISDVPVKEILPKYRDYSNGLTIQWTLYSDSDIKLCSENKSKIVDSPLKKATISDMLSSKTKIQITDLLAVVIGSKPSEYVGQKKDLLVQELTVVNEELRPIKLSLWNNFVDDQGNQLLAAMHERPIVLCKHLKVGSFKGLALQTTIGSTVIVQPKTSQAMEFRIWAMKHADQIATLAKQNAEGNLEPLFDMHQTEHHTPIAELKEDTTTWTQVKINMLKTQQACYYKACQKCHKKTSSQLGEEFFCTKCNNDQICVPWCLVDVELTDHSATVTATTFGKTAEILLGKKADEIAAMSSMDLQNYLLDMAMEYDSKNTSTLLTAKTSTNQQGTMKYTIQHVYKENLVAIKDDAEDRGTKASEKNPKEHKGTSTKKRKPEKQDAKGKPKSKVRLETRFETETDQQTSEKEATKLLHSPSKKRVRTRDSKLFAEVNASP